MAQELEVDGWFTPYYEFAPITSGLGASKFLVTESFGGFIGNYLTYSDPNEINYFLNNVNPINLYQSPGLSGISFYTFDSMVSNISQSGEITSTVYYNYIASSAPELSSWAYALMGLGFVGFSMRHRIRRSCPLAC